MDTCIISSYSCSLVILCICNPVMSKYDFLKINRLKISQLKLIYLISLLVTVESTIGQILYLIFYHFFFFMFCWSYVQTIFTDIGRVPNNVSKMILYRAVIYYLISIYFFSLKLLTQISRPICITEIHMICKIEY